MKCQINKRRVMFDSPIQIILLVEIIRTMIGFSLMIVEILRLRSTLTSRTTQYMIGILFFYNLIFLTRAIGITTNNINVRVFLPAISGLLAAIFLILWGSKIIKLDSLRERIAVGGISIGILLFMIGIMIDSILLIILGLIIFVGIMIIIMMNMYLFVFKKSPYILARYRVFLMFVGIVIMLVFEGGGVIAMRKELFNLASILFIIEIIGRITMTLSILLPSKVKGFLTRFIE